MKNQNGISLKTLVIIVVVIIFLAMIGGGSNDNNTGSGSTTSSSISSYSITKEDRSTYTAKCSPISYDALARNPDMYKGNDYVLTGKVIQVMEDRNDLTLRVNITAKKYEYSNETYYEDTILVNYKYSSSSESRILEDDIITIYGKSMGTYTYESVFGSTITVPAISAMYIDVKN